MSRNLLSTVAVISLMGLALTACQRQRRADVVVGGRPLTVAAQLDCPQTEGKLTRQSSAPDGQSCTYRGDDNTEITLMRTALSGRSASEAIKSVETELASAVPAHQSGGASDAEKGQVKNWDDENGSHAAHAEAHEHDRANIDLPGIHIHADGHSGPNNGDDKVQIRLPGVSIDANDGGARISTSLAGVKNAVIDANDSGAEIRADTTDAGNTERTWLLASDQPGPDGYHMVGYMARGPNGGPLVIAKIRSKEIHEHHFDHGLGFEDIKHLIALNLK